MQKLWKTIQGSFRLKILNERVGSNSSHTLKYLINKHKDKYLIKEHCGILTLKNKRTCWNVPYKRL